MDCGAFSIRLIGMLDDVNLHRKLHKKKRSSASALEDRHFSNIYLSAERTVSRTTASYNSKGLHQWTLTQVLNSYRPWLRGFLLGWHPLTSSMCSRKTSLILHTSNISACLSSAPPPARCEKPASDPGEVPRLLGGGLGNPCELLFCHSSQDEAADLGAGHSWWLFWMADKCSPYFICIWIKTKAHTLGGIK